MHGHIFIKLLLFCLDGSIQTDSLAESSVNNQRNAVSFLGESSSRSKNKGSKKKPASRKKHQEDVIVEPKLTGKEVRNNM
jgi:hypothetical protein